MVVRFVGRLLAAIGFVAVAGTAAAQQGRIVGKVTDEAGAAVASATVQAIEGLRTAGVTTTAEDGTYRFASLKAGTYGVRVTRIGFKPTRRDGIAVASAQVTVDFKLSEQPTQLNTVAVTGIAEEEKLNKAPAAISVLSQEKINETITATPVEQLRDVPGIDITAGGVVQTNVVARGFNNIFSGSLLTLTDNRFNFVPSLRVNISYMAPTSNEDIERIEVVLGPAAALYGPNATQGVMHVITKSPFNSKGGMITADVGEQNLRRLSGRYAGTVGTKFGYKLSAERLTATDFTSVDSVELKAGRQRLFDIERTAMDLRADWRPDAKTEVVANVGGSLIGSAVEPTGLGAGQIKDWQFRAYQLRAKRGRLFAQVFRNESDAGDTFLLRTGQPIVDKSSQTVGQVQHSKVFGADGHQTFVYGGDWLLTNPVTEGTINGRNEDDDNFTEVGGYLHSITHLNKYWQAVAAIRYDKHSRLDEGSWSPRAALVYNPNDVQSFRVSYNRGFSNPSTNNQFLDLAAGYVGGTNGSNSLYTVRALGTPSDGFQFRRDCAGGVGNLCMKSPFNPGGRSQFVPANAALFYKGAVAAAAAGGMGNAVRAALTPSFGAATAGALSTVVMNTLASLQPTSAQVTTKLRVLNPTTARFSDVLAGDVRDIDQIRPTLTTSWEAGWKGEIGKKFYGTVDWWYSERTDFVGPLIVETPNVFLDATSLAGYIGPNLVPALTAALTPALGPAAGPTAVAVAGQLAPTLAGGLGGVSGSATTGVPVGVVNPDHDLSGSTDIVLAYRNFGRVRVAGVDFSGNYIVGERLSLYGTYSWVSRDFFARKDVGGVSDIALNAPHKKSTVAIRYRDDSRGFGAEARFRHAAAFPGNSGVYVGPVRAYNLYDASFNFRPNVLGGAMLSVMAQNLLDTRHAEFIGGAPLGRMIMSRIQYSF
ncbi:MAG: TonB-dependent receptor [Gemmatimonadaceae bacterium]|nr:TonB-dependent receptor [Gemmatimonadaceae bacterium]